MSELYPDLPNTKFPEDKDNWGRFSDITSNDVQLVQQYQQYISDGEIDNARQLLTDNPTLKNKILSANNLNNLADAIIALERYYFSDIESYIINLSKYMGDWNNQTSYKKYNVVIYNSLAYFATQDVPVGEYPTNNTYWVQLTLKGDQGVSGVGLSYRYGWDVNTQYYAQDCVNYNNSLWAAKQDNVGQAPMLDSSYWELVMEDSNACVVDVVSQEPPDLINGQLWAKKITDSEAGANVGVELTIKDANGGKTLLPKTNSDYVDVKNGDYTSSLTSMLNSVKTNITDISKDLSGLKNSLNSEGQSNGNIPVWNGTAFEAGAPLESITQPNILINSDFAINQRGKTTYQSPEYSADRWFNSSTQSVTISANTCPFGIAKNMLSIVFQSNSYNTFSQPMENFSSVLNQNLTLSFWAKATNAGQIRVGIAYSNELVSLSTSWQKFTVHLNPTAEHGTWNLNGFYIQSPSNVASSNQVGTVSIAEPQLVYGTYAGQYIPPDPATELVKCQRFYQRLYNTSDNNERAIFPAVVQGSNTWIAQGWCPFKVTMRAVPQMTWHLGSGLDTNGLAASVNGIDVNKSGFNQYETFVLKYEADAEIYS